MKKIWLPILVALPVALIAVARPAAGQFYSTPYNYGWNGGGAYTWGGGYIPQEVMGIMPNPSQVLTDYASSINASNAPRMNAIYQQQLAIEAAQKQQRAYQQQQAQIQQQLQQHLQDNQNRLNQPQNQ